MFIIQPIQKLIMDYASSDYKKIYDSVMRDMNWFSSYIVLRKYIFVIPHYNSPEHFNELTKGIQQSWFGKYRQVLMDLNPETRFFQGDKRFKH